MMAASTAVIITQTWKAPLPNPSNLQALQDVTCILQLAIAVQHRSAPYSVVVPQPVGCDAAAGERAPPNLYYTSCTALNYVTSRRMATTTSSQAPLVKLPPADVWWREGIAASSPIAEPVAAGGPCIGVAVVRVVSQHPANGEYLRLHR